MSENHGLVAGSMRHLGGSLTIRNHVIEPTALTFPGMFTIRPGGVVELEDDVTLDEASQAFWDMVRRTAPSLADDTTPDDLRQVRARAYADGVLAALAGITDTRLPGSNDDEEDDRG